MCWLKPCYCWFQASCFHPHCWWLSPDIFLQYSKDIAAYIPKQLPIFNVGHQKIEWDGRTTIHSSSRWPWHPLRQVPHGMLNVNSVLRQIQQSSHTGPEAIFLFLRKFRTIQAVTGGQLWATCCKQATMPSTSRAATIRFKRRGPSQARCGAAQKRQHSFPQSLAA